jgi:hypothetical protein
MPSGETRCCLSRPELKASVSSVASSVDEIDASKEARAFATAVRTGGGTSSARRRGAAEAAAGRSAALSGGSARDAA